MISFMKIRDSVATSASLNLVFNSPRVARGVADAGLCRRPTRARPPGPVPPASAPAQQQLMTLLP